MSLSKLELTSNNISYFKLKVKVICISYKLGVA